MKKGRLLFVFVCIFITRTAYTQNIISVSGTVRDKETNKPLASASVGIMGKYIGTITNNQGDFDIHIPTNLGDDTLFVSIIGYKSFASIVSKIAKIKSFDIYLEPHVTMLEEVVVSPGPSPQEKLKMSFENVGNNYPIEPFEMQGFYREIKRYNGIYVSLIEAAVALYDMNGYKKTKLKLLHKLDDIDEKGVIRQIRKSYNFFDEEVEGQIGLHNNLLAYLLTQNLVRYPVKMIEAKELEDNTVYLGDQLVYEIIKRQGGNELKYYLDSDTYALIEYVELRKGNYFERKISDTVSLKYNDMSKRVKFRSVDDILYPEHLTLSWTVEKYSVFSKKITRTLETSLDLLINKINIDNVKAPSSKEKMEIFSLEWQVGKYDPDFWKNYNMIKETPLNKKIVSDLEKEVPLKKQFVRPKH